MAQTVYLELFIDGQKVDGECSITTANRQDTIECLSFRLGVSTPESPPMRSGSRPARTASNKHAYTPVIIKKPVCKASPRLFQALCKSETVTEATFVFFRPSKDRAQAGQEVMYYSIRLENGLISSIKQINESDRFADDFYGQMPTAIEEIKLTFKKITMTYEIGGITYVDTIP